jgi:cytidylate kinase
MNIITISRQYGAGGGEVGKRLAEVLGWELLDRELLHRAAEIEHVPDGDLERLDEKALSMADHLRLRPPHRAYLHGLKTAVEQAAQRGNAVLVGRGARQLLGKTPGVFHLRLVAPKEWRARRMAGLEGLPLEQALARLTEVDRTRDHFFRYFFGSQASLPAEYDLVVNTGRLFLEDVVAVVAAIVRQQAIEAIGRPPGRRVLTLARELGAGERGFPPTLGDRLQMQLFDRELLERQAVRLGVPESELEKIDEHAPGIFQRFLPGSIYQRYREALEQSMRELAGRGDMIIVGRGGSRFLRDDPRAFHVRLVAPLPVRIRRVMEYHWIREEVARRRISASDAARRRFYEDYFGADWASPLEYDATVNSGRLGATAVDAVVLAANRYWSRTVSPAPAIPI